MIDWADFHFLRPEWLLALALLIPLCWAGIRGRRSAGAWRGVCDAHLLKHLITNGGGGTRLWPLALMALVVIGLWQRRNRINRQGQYLQDLGEMV